MIDISTDDARFMARYEMRQRRLARLRCVTGHDWRHDIDDFWACHKCSLVSHDEPERTAPGQLEAGL